MRTLSRTSEGAGAAFACWTHRSFPSRVHLFSVSKKETWSGCWFYIDSLAIRWNLSLSLENVKLDIKIYFKKYLLESQFIFCCIWYFILMIYILHNTHKTWNYQPLKEFLELILITKKENTRNKKKAKRASHIFLYTVITVPDGSTFVIKQKVPKWGTHKM